ncbi:hypothetical protein AB2B41_00875 [Marimonas sp. MJW-29]|uniref:CPBP family intramembrane metalloprotease n=1 Tax=Sulfitobacter sediminis TaxID=3234186 RepID=A0ABV3RGP7_9RHOB
MSAAIPALIGAGLGGVIFTVLWLSGMSRERSAGAVILVAIAAFYPVFAFENGAWGDRIFHLFFFALFLCLALWGYRRSARAVALGIAGHGVFDLAILPLSAPTPDWWPTFCAGLDIVLGLALFLLWRKERPL